MGKSRNFCIEDNYTKMEIYSTVEKRIFLMRLWFLCQKNSRFLTVRSVYFHVFALSLVWVETEKWWEGVGKAAEDMTRSLNGAISSCMRSVVVAVLVENGVEDVDDSSCLASLEQVPSEKSHEKSHPETWDARACAHCGHWPSLVPDCMSLKA